MLSTEIRDAALDAWLRVFRSTDPFGWPFSDAISCGRVLFPTDGCHLSPEQFGVLAKVARSTGESTCYLAVVEGYERLGGSTEEKMYLVDLSDYEGYVSLHLTLENAIYSPSGRWGVLISHEMHGILGGDAEFVATFNRMDPKADEQWQMFKAEWSLEKHKCWLEEIASHLV